MSRITQVISPSSTNTTTTSTSYIGGLGYGAAHLERTKYDGEVHSYFVVHGLNTDPTPMDPPNNYGTFKLRDETNGVDIIELRTDQNRVSGSSNLLIGDITDYWNAYPDIVTALYFKSNDATNTSYLRNWHIVITQDSRVGAPVTKTRTFINVGHNVNTTSTSYAEDTRPKRWLHTAGDLEGTLAVKFGAVFYQQTAGQTANFELYNRTAAAQVAGSELTETGQTVVYKEATGLSLTDANEYTARRKTSATGTCVNAGAYLIIDQDNSGSPLTKTVSVQQTCITTFASTAEASTDDLGLFNEKWFQGCTVTTYAEYVMAPGAGGLNVTGKVRGGGTDLTGASVSTTTGGFNRHRSGSVTLPTTQNVEIDSTVTGGSGFSGTMSSGRLIYNITAITVGPAMTQPIVYQDPGLL